MGRLRTALAHSPVKPVIALFLCLFLATACDEENPIRPTVPPGEPFVLAPGESASIAGATMRMRFEGVASDSRCPIDAICVRAGDAVVVIDVFDEAGSSRYDLTTGEPNRKSVTHGHVRIELVELQPYPMSSRPTDPAAYRATFTATGA